MRPPVNPSSRLIDLVRRMFTAVSGHFAPRWLTPQSSTFRAFSSSYWPFPDKNRRWNGVDMSLTVGLIEPAHRQSSNVVLWPVQLGALRWARSRGRPGILQAREDRIS